MPDKKRKTSGYDSHEKMPNEEQDKNRGKSFLKNRAEYKEGRKPDTVSGKSDTDSEKKDKNSSKKREVKVNLTTYQTSDTNSLRNSKNSDNNIYRHRGEINWQTPISQVNTPESNLWRRR